jgi:hypothetical protein
MMPLMDRTLPSVRRIPSKSSHHLGSHADSSGISSRSFCQNSIGLERTLFSLFGAKAVIFADGQEGGNRIGMPLARRF